MKAVRSAEVRTGVTSTRADRGGDGDSAASDSAATAMGGLAPVFASVADEEVGALFQQHTGQVRTLGPEFLRHPPELADVLGLQVGGAPGERLHRVEELIQREALLGELARARGGPLLRGL